MSSVDTKHSAGRTPKNGAAPAAAAAPHKKTLAPSKAQLAAGASAASAGAGAAGVPLEKYDLPLQADLWRPHVESFDWMLGAASSSASAASAAAIASNYTTPGGPATPTKGGPAGATPMGDGDAPRHIPSASSGAAAAPALSGLELAVQTLQQQYIDAIPEHALPTLRFLIDSVSIGTPTKERSNAADSRLFPHECRELGITYDAPLIVNLLYSVGGGPMQRVQRKMGNVPIMVKSARCHLKHLSGAELIAHKEEESEHGGYFILNGIERIVRLLVVNRRNHVTAIIRSTFANRGKEYSKFGCMIRCVRPDQSAQSMTVHYLENGTCTIRFTLKKNEYFVPCVLLLRALIDTTDKEMYDSLVQGNVANTFLTDRAEIMLRDSKRLILKSRSAVLAYLGSHFRSVLRPEGSLTDEQVGSKLLTDYVFIHCAHTNESVRNRQKYDLLIFMIRKLYALVQGEIKPDNPDALSSHEILLPGHLYNIYLKEKLHDWLSSIKDNILRDIRTKPQNVAYSNAKYMKKIFDQSGDVCKAMSSWIVTGNLTSKTGLDLQQVTGYTIVADKLNFFRYLSHFRSVHRGQFFAEQKTTTPRKLLPESWGFMCPVHTPDGSPCGLLNHLAGTCEILTHNPVGYVSQNLVKLLGDLGMIASAIPPVIHPHSYLVVMLDGIVVGHVPPNLVHALVRSLRTLKVNRHADVPRMLEIAAIYDMLDGIYPGIYLSTAAARMMRPVYNITSSPPRIEYIGPFEQMFLDVACTADDYREGETTHQEIAPTNMLSAIAGFTPFSDFNQSPRNMYQCQMGKQTMGTPFHSYPHRVDNKFYRLQTPQRPLVRNASYVRLGMDEYPIGTNAVVAVISYTGYDMEDAMILNKSSYERGFGHASIYTYKPIDLSEHRERGAPITTSFSNTTTAPPRGGGRGRGKPEAKAPAAAAAGPVKPRRDNNTLDWDGLPFTGQRIQPEEAVYVTYDDVKQRFKTKLNTENKDLCYVDEVRLLGSKEGKDEECQQVGLKLRFNRNPLIGDKFCLSSHDTQLLTRRDGWVYVTQLTESMEVACLDPATGALRYDKPIGIYRFKHTGKMYEVNSPHVDLNVTLNHRMYTKSSAAASAFELRPASELVGCTGVQYRRHATPPHTDAAIDSIACAKAAAQLLAASSDDDALRIHESVLAMDALHSQSVIRCALAASESDDSASLHGRTIACGASGRVADVWQQLALHAGWSADVIATCNDSAKSRVAVVLNTIANTPTIESSDRQRVHSSLSALGGDEVFCIEVPTHIFYVRRNGKPVWTGNSSRHGQKGVLSVLWPQEDMPFSDSGMSPDIIINPHAFPSRMTIGMLVESLAGKSGACHGMYQDGTPFRYNEQHRAVDYFGEQLASAGYNYYGTETLYSGVSGVQLQAEIYIGVVYYQRLRHMVSDKYQVRATGPINPLHRQPIKGRKRHGGIRFGEMERDSLIAHGAAFLLHDRLMNCSDYNTSFVCTKCGSLLSSWTVNAGRAGSNHMKVLCRNCASSRHCATVAMPYVFNYLVNELAAMNIRLTLDVK